MIRQYKKRLDAPDERWHCAPHDGYRRRSDDRHNLEEVFSVSPIPGRWRVNSLPHRTGFQPEASFLSAAIGRPGSRREQPSVGPRSPQPPSRRVSVSLFNPDGTSATEWRLHYVVRGTGAQDEVQGVPRSVIEEPDRITLRCRNSSRPTNGSSRCAAPGPGSGHVLASTSGEMRRRARRADFTVRIAHAAA